MEMFIPLECFPTVIPSEILDASHSTKTFEETAADGTEIARKSSRNSGNWRIFDYSTKNSRSSGSKVE